MKRTISLVLTLLLVISLTGCAAAPAAEADAQIILDQDGFEVTLPKQIERIVVCDILPLPSVLAVFFDSAEKIVGISATSMNAAEHSLLGQLYPELLEAETGFINGSTVNAEELMKLQPDVVFYNASRKELGETLRKAGFPAVAISVNKWEYNCIETLNQWISLLSQLFPDNNKAQIVESYSQKVYELVQSRVSTIPEAEREQAFFLYQYSDTNLQTSGKQFFGQWWADAIGVRNVAEALSSDNSVSVNMEQVYAWNPSLIFITNFTTADEAALYQNTVGTYDWSIVDAVKNQRVYKMPLGMYRSYTPGVDTPITLLWMAKTAYPALFEDIDIIRETKTYYQEVFDITLTDAQAESIFTPTAQAGSGF
ncbi:MAG: ABC transporter substrate-binding protein [Oscillospiraceae bacterium]|nr:ABC transporter substrate-binding protein [Oscillospiraceae bacterium]